MCEIDNYVLICVMLLQEGLKPLGCYGVGTWHLLVVVVVVLVAAVVYTECCSLNRGLTCVLCGAGSRDVRERAPSPRLLKAYQPSPSRGIQAIKEDPDMLDSELSVLFVVACIN